MRAEAGKPFETELYREQIDATLDLAVEIASDDIDLENARHD